MQETTSEFLEPSLEFECLFICLHVSKLIKQFLLQKKLNSCKMELIRLQHFKYSSIFVKICFMNLYFFSFRVAIFIIWELTGFTIFVCPSFVPSQFLQCLVCQSIVTLKFSLCLFRSRLVHSYFRPFIDPLKTIY